MDEKKILRLQKIGWVCFALAVISFLGLFNFFETSEKAGDTATKILVSEALGLPDFTTIILAGISVFLGHKIKKICKENGIKDKGKKLMVSGIVCIVLTFTPLSAISIIPSLMVVTIENALPDGREEIPEQDYILYAFLGPDYSYPGWVDIWSYDRGYDGSALEAYEKYKICGFMKNESGEWLEDVLIEFVLVDADGNDILIDGKPVVLTTEDSYMSISSGELEGFETELIDADDLPVQPVNFRVQRATEIIYEDAF